MPLPLRSAVAKVSHYGHAATGLALFHAQQVAEEFVARHGRPEHLKSDAALYTPTSLMRVRIVSSRIHEHICFHTRFVCVACYFSFCRLLVESPRRKRWPMCFTSKAKS